MPSNFSPEPPKHRVEFTGSSAPKKRRKPPPKWIIGWCGGLLLFVAGAALGGFTANALIWMLFIITDDVGSPIVAMLTLFLGTIVGAVAGSIAGLFVWHRLRARACASED